jgi:hypothetical protein
MGKHRKKSKRQKSEASGDEGPCHDPAVKSMSPVLSSTESKHGSEEKKRKRKEDEPIVSSEALLEQDSSSKAKCRKKKKSKKSKKKRSGDEVDLTEESSSSHSVEIVDDTSPLEGSMVGDGQMVLIDRTKGIVFDAFDREENGARKQVGIVKDGKIQLTTVNEKQKGTQYTLDPISFSLFVACIEAGLDLFSMVFSPVKYRARVWVHWTG